MNVNIGDVSGAIEALVRFGATFDTARSGGPTVPLVALSVRE